jgi:hypothetical protein
MMAPEGAMNCKTRSSYWAVSPSAIEWRLSHSPKAKGLTMETEVREELRVMRETIIHSLAESMVQREVLSAVLTQISASQLPALAASIRTRCEELLSRTDDAPNTATLREQLAIRTQAFLALIEKG